MIHSGMIKPGAKQKLTDIRRMTTLSKLRLPVSADFGKGHTRRREEKCWSSFHAKPRRHGASTKSSQVPHNPPQASSTSTMAWRSGDLGAGQVR